MKKLKQRLAFVGALLVLASFNHTHQYDANYAILENDEAFASYSDGLIYIGSKQYIDTICPNEGDVFVIDSRYGVDPNLEVLESDIFADKDIRNEILEVLCEYEKRDPSPWNRTIESMRLEWLIHNISSFLGYEKTRSSAVDFNNADEAKYNSKILRKIFHI